MKTKILYTVAALLALLLAFQIGRISAGQPSSAGDEPEMRTREDAEGDDSGYFYPEDYDDFEAYISNRFEGMPTGRSFVATDANGGTVALDTLASPTTVFARYLATGCRPCIDAMVDALKLYVRKDPSARAVVLIKNVALRDLYVLNKELGHQFVLLSADRLPTDFNDGETPYMFRIAENRIADHFTCRYGDGERTKNYVEQIN